MKKLLFLLLISAVSKVYAQTSFNSLQEVLLFADKNNSRLQQAVINERIVSKDQESVRSSLLPKLNAYSTADYYPVIPAQVIPGKLIGGSGDKFTKVQFGLPLNFSGGVEFNMPLINFEKWETLRKAAWQNEEAKWSTDAEKEKLHQQLVDVYYRILMARQFLELNKENAAVTEELIQIMELRKKQGVLNPSDYNRAKNLSLDIKTAGVEYEKMEAIYLNALKTLLSLPLDESLIVHDSIEGEWTNPLLTDPVNRPEMRQATVLVHLSEQAVREARKASLPRLSLNGRYYHQWGLQPSSNTGVHFDAAQIGLRLDVPLFNGNSYRITQQKTEWQLKAAQVHEQEVKESLNKEQKDWWINYTAAQKKENLLSEKLATASENLRIARLSLKEGVMEYDEFSSVFFDYVRCRIDRAQNIGEGMIYQLLLMQKF